MEGKGKDGEKERKQQQGAPVPALCALLLLVKLMCPQLAEGMLF